jgi:hypothetical protein
MGPLAFAPQGGALGWAKHWTFGPETGAKNLCRTLAV